MFSVLQDVFNSQTWFFNNGNAYDQEQPDGRGAFIRQATISLNTADNRWGYISKHPPQNCYIFSSPGPNYNAIDAIIFKDDDGVTAEIYDVISGSGVLQWNFDDRTTANLALWFYPI